MKPARETRRIRTPMTKTGHRKAWMHSLSGLEASQMPAAIMGMEQRRAMKLRTAVILLLTPMHGGGVAVVVVVTGEVGGEGGFVFRFA